MNTKKLLSQVERYKELQAKELELTMEMNELKEAFKSLLTKQKVDEILIDKYRVSLLKYTKNSFDSKKFKKEHEDMFNDYSNTKQIESVVVK